MSINGVASGQNPYRWPSFQSADTDGDNSLSLAEFGAAGQNVPGGLSSLDNSSLQNLFSAIDADGDGKISRTEATTAFDKLSNAMQSQLLGVQEQSGASSPGQMFASADTDGSGGLSFDEFKASFDSNLPSGATAPSDDQLKTMFDKLDANGDGSVSQSEMKAARHHHRGHMPPPDAASSTAASDTSTSTSPDSTLQNVVSGLLQQAMSAYGLGQSASPQTNPGDLVNQIIDVLKAA